MTVQIMTLRFLRDSSFPLVCVYTRYSSMCKSEQGQPKIFSENDEKKEGWDNRLN